MTRSVPEDSSVALCPTWETYLEQALAEMEGIFDAYVLRNPTITWGLTPDTHRPWVTLSLGDHTLRLLSWPPRTKDARDRFRWDVLTSEAGIFAFGYTYDLEEAFYLGVLASRAMGAAASRPGEDRFDGA